VSSAAAVLIPHTSFGSSLSVCAAYGSRWNNSVSSCVDWHDPCRSNIALNGTCKNCANCEGWVQSTVTNIQLVYSRHRHHVTTKLIPHSHINLWASKSVPVFGIRRLLYTDLNLKTGNYKNLAITNRSRVGCAHNTSRASICPIIHDLEI